MRRLATLLVAAVLVGGCATDIPATGSGTGVVPSGPVASASPPASAGVSAAAVPALLWSRITSVDAPDPAGDFRRIAGFSGGYVALVQTPATAVFSPDGTEWATVVLAVPNGEALRAATVASDGEHVVIGGSYTPCTHKAYDHNPYQECRPRPASWASSDGLAWTPSAPYDGPNGDPLRSGSAFEAVWPIPTGGWDAGQMFNRSDESDEMPPSGPAIWHSADGLSWAPLTSPPGDEPACGDLGVSDRMHAVADATGRRVVSASESLSDCTSPLWTSADGREYTNVDTFPHAGENAFYTVVFAADGELPWRVLGGDEASGGQVWTSVDLEAWSMTPLASDGATRTVPLAGIRAGGRDVVVGATDRSGATWISDDGTTWQSVDEGGTKIEALADGPAGILGLIGSWNDDGDGLTGFDVYRLGEQQ